MTISLNQIEVNIYKPHGNHTSKNNNNKKSYIRYIKSKRKGTQAYYRRKSSNQMEGTKRIRNEQRITTQTTGKQVIKWQ